MSIPADYERLLRYQVLPREAGFTRESRELIDPSTVRNDPKSTKDDDERANITRRMAQVMAKYEETGQTRVKVGNSTYVVTPGKKIERVTDPETLFGITLDNWPPLFKRMNEEQLSALPDSLERHAREILATTGDAQVRNIQEMMRDCAYALDPMGDTPHTLGELPRRSTHRPLAGITPEQSAIVNSLQGLAIESFYRDYITTPGFDDFPRNIAPYLADTSINMSDFRARMVLVKAMAPGEANVLTNREYRDYPVITTSDAGRISTFREGGKGRDYVFASTNDGLIAHLNEHTDKQDAVIDEYTVWRNTYYKELHSGEMIDGWLARTREFDQYIKRNWNDQTPAEFIKRADAENRAYELEHPVRNVSEMVIAPDAPDVAVASTTPAPNMASAALAAGAPTRTAIAKTSVTAATITNSTSSAAVTSDIPVEAKYRRYAKLFSDAEEIALYLPGLSQPFIYEINSSGELIPPTEDRLPSGITTHRNETGQPFIRWNDGAKEYQLFIDPSLNNDIRTTYLSEYGDYVRNHRGMINNDFGPNTIEGQVEVRSRPVPAVAQISEYHGETLPSPVLPSQGSAIARG